MLQGVVVGLIFRLVYPYQACYAHPTILQHPRVYHTLCGHLLYPWKEKCWYSADGDVMLVITFFCSYYYSYLTLSFLSTGTLYFLQNKMNIVAYNRFNVVELGPRLIVAEDDHTPLDYWCTGCCRPMDAFYFPLLLRPPWCLLAFKTPSQIW